MTTTAVAVTFDEMSRLAEAVAKSNLFGMKTPEQALALMAIAQAEGTHPALAARDYDIVQGRPTLKATAMLARFQNAGGVMRYIERTDARVVAEFSHPVGGKVTVDWDVERAKKAGLYGKGTWQQYTRQMLTARVISEGIKAVFPGAASNLLTPEEASDIPYTEEAERDVTPPKPATGVAALQARISTLTEEERKFAIEKDRSAIEEQRPPLELDGTAPPTATFAEVSDQIAKAVKAHDTDALMMAVDLMRSVPDEQQRAELDVEARAAWKAIKRKPEQAKAEAYQAATRG